MGVHRMAKAAVHLPQAVSRQLVVRQLDRRVKRYGSQILRDLPAVIEKEMDRGKLQELWQEVRDDYERDRACAAKYAVPRQWLFLNVLRAGDLGLHLRSGLRILDIGCGPGYFMAVSRALGHQIEGVDAPDSFLRPIERRVYSALIEILRCEPHVRPLLIERFVPMPNPEERYDLITAFWICFNCHRQPDEWSVLEWRYFVEDALERLRPGGRLYLDLNENAERYGQLRFYDAPTLEYFRSVGEVSGGHVLVSKRS